MLLLGIQQSDSVMYVYIHTRFLDSFPLQVIKRCGIEFLMLYSRPFCLFVVYIYANPKLLQKCIYLFRIVLGLQKKMSRKYRQITYIPPLPLAQSFPYEHSAFGGAAWFQYCIQLLSQSSLTHFPFTLTWGLLKADLKTMFRTQWSLVKEGSVVRGVGSEMGEGEIAAKR